MVVILNPVCVLLSVECFMFRRATKMLQFSKLDDLQNTGFDRLKIVLFGAAGSKAEGNISYNCRFHIVKLFKSYFQITKVNFSQSLQ